MDKLIERYKSFLDKGKTERECVKEVIEIAEKEGFEYDANWTTRQFGSKLIDFLNEKE